MMMDAVVVQEEFDEEAEEESAKEETGATKFPDLCSKIDCEKMKVYRLWIFF